jgi:hypothetical protein
MLSKRVINVNLLVGRLTAVAAPGAHRAGRCKMVSNSIWYRRLVLFGSAIISAIREIIIRAINDGDVRKVSDRIGDYVIDTIIMLFISAVLVIGIIVVWVEVIFMVVWFLLFLLGSSL